MKREFVSAAIGAGIVGAIWAGSAYFNRGRRSLPPETEKTAAQPKAVDARHPGRMRKPVAEVYSALPDGKFPGLKLYGTDFLIPLNRLSFTDRVHIDDPKGFYGSGGHPMYAFMFGIREGEATHYFLTSGLQGKTIADLVYLGKDIELEKLEIAGNGFWMATYKDGNGRPGYGFVAVSNITGGEPVSDTGVAQPIGLDPLAKYAEKCDPFVWKMNAEQFWETYRKAIRDNDRETVAKMYNFPIERNGKRIYTRAEFLEEYDRICTPEMREWILNGCNSREIMYSWRGALLPSGAWLINACGKNEPAGPLED